MVSIELEVQGLADGLIDCDPLTLGIGPRELLKVDFTAFAGDPAAVA